MKKIMILLIVFVLSSATWAAADYLGGEIVMDDGTLYKIEKIDASIAINGKYKNEKIRKELHLLKKIEKLENNYCKLTDKEDKEILLSDCACGDVEADQYSNILAFGFEYEYFDKEAGEIKEISYNGNYAKDSCKFSTILFYGHIGKMKFNEKTKQWFPPGYIFDPYTGEKLIWNTPTK